MIPKKIHYCWFGRNPLDEKAEKCILSWTRFFPDYEIIQWNEDNFDVNQIDFMKKAYEDKKWAFVSDVARLIVIYRHGGIYFDTDVEVVKSFDDILNKNTVGYFGMEKTLFVNSGLGFACEAGNAFIKRHIDAYKEINYEKCKGNLSEISCPRITTPLLEHEGFVKIDKKQTVMGFDIYPPAYFSPIDYQTGKLKRDKKTHTIHWFAASWDNNDSREEQRKLRSINRLFGRKLGNIVYGITSCMRKEGFFLYCAKRVKQVWRRLVK